MLIGDSESIIYFGNIVYIKNSLKCPLPHDHTGGFILARFDFFMVSIVRIYPTVIVTGGALPCQHIRKITQTPGIAAGNVGLNTVIAVVDTFHFCGKNVCPILTSLLGQGVRIQLHDSGEFMLLVAVAEMEVFQITANQPKQSQRLFAGSDAIMTLPR